MNKHNVAKKDDSFIEQANGSTIVLLYRSATINKTTVQVYIYIYIYIYYSIWYLNQISKSNILVYDCSNDSSTLPLLFYNYCSSNTSTTLLLYTYRFTTWLNNIFTIYIMPSLFVHCQDSDWYSIYNESEHNRVYKGCLVLFLDKARVAYVLRSRLWKK